MRVGWIKLHRKITEHPDYLGETFTRMQAWIDLLLTANYRDGFIRVRGIAVPVKRGQIATSSLSLAKRWMWSRGKVHRYLNELETSKQIEQQNSNVITLISIVKYDSFQLDDTANDSADCYADETADGQQTDTSKEYKEEQEDNTRTHTVIDSNKGGAGGNVVVSIDSVEPMNVEAMELIDWIARTYPELAAKKHPLTCRQVEWLLRKHSAEDIRRIVAQVADNKRTTEKENVYCRVVTFFRYDRSDGNPEAPKKQYSWDEVLSAVNRQEVKSTAAFVRVEDNGKVYWIKNR